jgi:hypothetical protein
MREHIDESAQKIMKSMIRDERTRITPEHQARIAAWAALKVMSSEFDLGTKVSVKRTDRISIMNTFRAPKILWAVWGRSLQED